MPQRDATQSIEYDGTRAPEFPDGLRWFNTLKPLSIKELRGKIVLLDFWTYGCINCLHIIPDLKKLEAKYPNELVIIGVHSAKFEAESKPEHLRQAMMRYGIEHPVVSDENLRIWSEYTVRAWPTLVLIDPIGKVVRSFQGEGHYHELDEIIGLLIQNFRREQKLNGTPIEVTVESSKVGPTPLYFPGKISVENYVVIADSGHNRLVLLDKNGKILTIIGSGKAGLQDGDFNAAQFSNPQGIFIEGQQIYVADTNKHTIRLVDLAIKKVRSIAGTGKQAPWLATGGQALQSPLSSPWDVLKVGDSLYIAMAGTHQIWRLNLKTNTIAPFAGSGAEGRHDGDLAEAAFAQPSGLATDGTTLFVADSESSCIRAVDISGKTNEVKTLTGGDLFDFGDRDGRGDSALFQHPLGITYKNGLLYIADTYNSKIKRLNPKTGEVQTVFSNDLNEPSGLAFDGETLLIADTNSHQIKRLDLESNVATPLELSDLKPPVSSTIGETVEVIIEPMQILAPHQEITLEVVIELATEFKLNSDAMQQLEIILLNDAGQSTITTLGVSDLKPLLPIPIPAQKDGNGVIKIVGVLNYCSNNEDEGLCKFQRLNHEIPFEMSSSGVKKVNVRLELA